MNLEAGIMSVGMDLTGVPYSATATQEWGRAISCKRVYPCWKSKNGVADRLP